MGGGTAGLTIASRLTEDPNISVVVLEAGNDHSNDTNVLSPGLYTGMYGNPEYDWNYHTVPQVPLRVMFRSFRNLLTLSLGLCRWPSRSAPTREAIGRFQRHQLPVLDPCISKGYRQLGSIGKCRLVLGCS